MRRAKDKSDEWRGAFVCIYSHIFNQWVQTRQTITIKPNESARDLERSLAKEKGINPIDLFLNPMIDAE